MATGNQLTRGRVKLGKGMFTVVARFTATVNPASAVDAGGETIALTALTGSMVGAALGDIVLCGPGVDLAGLLAQAYVSAADTVKVRVQNESGGTVDLASSTWNFLVLRMF